MHLILALLALGLLVFFHEFGHFMAARWAGVTVEEFAVGFGPALLSTTRGETRYRLNVVPFGGYCKMLGEDEMMTPEPETREEIREAEGNFNNKSVLKRAIIVSSGVFMNIFIAFLAFVTIAAVAGVPQVVVEVEEVFENSPASEAGLRSGDRILTVADRPIEQGDEVVRIVSNSPGEEVELLIERDGEKQTVVVVPERREVEGEDRGWIGVGLLPIQQFERDLRSPLQLIGYGFRETVGMMVMIVSGFYQLFSGQVSFDSVAGPVGMIEISRQVAQTGIINLMFFGSFISINLALINLFPFPALDGGRLVFLGIEAVRGRPVSPEKEGVVHWVGFMILILFMVFITMRDVIRIF